MGSFSLQKRRLQDLLQKNLFFTTQANCSDDILTFDHYIGAHHCYCPLLGAHHFFFVFVKWCKTILDRKKRYFNKKKIRIIFGYFRSQELIQMTRYEIKRFGTSKTGSQTGEK